MWSLIESNRKKSPELNSAFAIPPSQCTHELGKAAMEYSVFRRSSWQA
jgi:hypothetical protein